MLKGNSLTADKNISGTTTAQINAKSLQCFHRPAMPIWTAAMDEWWMDGGLNYEKKELAVLPAKLVLKFGSLLPITTSPVLWRKHNFVVVGRKILPQELQNLTLRVSSQPSNHVSLMTSKRSSMWHKKAKHHVWNVYEKIWKQCV